MTNRKSVDLKIEEQKKRLGKSLLKILEEAEIIMKEMETIPHIKGLAQRSLKPKSDLYIVQGLGGFQAVYERENIEYEIRVQKITKLAKPL